MNEGHGVKVVGANDQWAEGGHAGGEILEGTLDELAVVTGRGTIGCRAIVAISPQNIGNAGFCGHRGAAHGSTLPRRCHMTSVETCSTL